MYRRLKLTRVAVSIFCIIVMTATLVGLLPSSVGKVIMDIQFMHLLISGSVAWLALWLCVTLMAGRIYCSTVCPAGTFFDIAARLLRRRRRYAYTRANNALRYGAAALTIICIVLPVRLVPTLLDPDSAYSIICWETLRPVVVRLKDLLGAPPVYVASVATLGLLTASGLLFIWALMARAGGRMYCNSLCPAGALLSLVSRNSILQFDINTDVCTHCGACSDVCKAQCINHTEGTVDMSRCVVCFNCTDVCRDKAISYTTRRHLLSTPMMRRIKGLAPDAMGEPPVLNNELNKPITKGSDETIS